MSFACWTLRFFLMPKSATYCQTYWDVRSFPSSLLRLCPLSKGRKTGYLKTGYLQKGLEVLLKGLEADSRKILQNLPRWDLWKVYWRSNIPQDSARIRIKSRAGFLTLRVSGPSFYICLVCLSLFCLLRFLDGGVRFGVVFLLAGGVVNSGESVGGLGLCYFWHL